MDRKEFIKLLSISAVGITAGASLLPTREEKPKTWIDKQEKVSPKGIPLKNHSGLKSQIESCNCEYYNIITKKELENFIEQFI